LRRLFLFNPCLFKVNDFQLFFKIIMPNLVSSCNGTGAQAVQPSAGLTNRIRP
jgi:hypothetical protein